MKASSILDGTRRPLPRSVVRRDRIEGDAISLAVATEDIAAPTDWCFEQPSQVLVVHLDGAMTTMESVFAGGPSTDTLPAIGDIWAIPAGSRYAALAQGDQVRFAEFTIPAGLVGDGDLIAKVGHRDPFLHHAAERAASLIDREDDMARMALEALLVVIRFHIREVYLQASNRPEGPPRMFSDRQKARLVEYIDQCLHESITLDDLAVVCGVSTRQLMKGFKSTFGMTPWQYVLKTRLARARLLLEGSDSSISVIAAETGFSSASHFATAFGKHFGFKPSAYRQSTRHRD